MTERVLGNCTCLMKISRSRDWPHGLYLRLNLSKRWKMFLSACMSSVSTFRSCLHFTQQSKPQRQVRNENAGVKVARGCFGHSCLDWSVLLRLSWTRSGITGASGCALPAGESAAGDGLMLAVQTAWGHVHSLRF